MKFWRRFLETPDASTEIPTTPTTPIKEKNNWWRFSLDLLETILLSVVLFLGINAVTARVRVDGMSMRPTLENGQYVLVSKMAYRSDLPDYGDVVVFHFPANPKEDYIKRVIARPGDKVLIEDGQVTVNGIILNEEYIAASPNYSGNWSVPENHLFVLGDNRNDSSDSHSGWTVPMENVIGKAIVIYWPPPQWNIIDHVQVAIAAP
ncbi:MAG: signal peptidase I [Anaerolinea sp. 4484_236]|nr:MAG: signal peptidase I [Anaerolinea sp. 4484_236]